MRFFDNENAAMMTMGERRALNAVCESIMDSDPRWLALREEIMGEVLDAWSPALTIADMCTRVRRTRRNRENDKAFSELAQEASALLKRGATRNA